MWYIQNCPLHFWKLPSSLAYYKQPKVPKSRHSKQPKTAHTPTCSGCSSTKDVSLLGEINLSANWPLLSCEVRGSVEEPNMAILLKLQVKVRCCGGVFRVFDTAFHIVEVKIWALQFFFNIVTFGTVCRLFLILADFLCYEDSVDFKFILPNNNNSTLKGNSSWEHYVGSHG